MRSPLKFRMLRGALIVGVVLGFGSGVHHLAHRAYGHGPDHLTRVCVDAALGQPVDPHGRRARWVAERCADHARAVHEAPAP